MKKSIIPAIIAKTQEELDERLLRVNDYFDVVQLDVMDNIFVPNTSLFFDFNLPDSTCHYEAHLMVQDPADWILNNWEKVDLILVHFESSMNPRQIIDMVKEKGKAIGFVINPETPVHSISEFVDDLDQVLIMTVNPGFYGSPFLPEMVDKIKELRRMKPDINIEVDGGITDKTIGLVDKGGANMFVSGSYLVKSENVQEARDCLKQILKKETVDHLN
jgi:ribulose-phosphate 3-epimerase